MDHEIQTRQVDATRGDIGGHADPRAPVPERLQGLIALALTQFARQGDDREAAFQEMGLMVPHRLPGVAENQGRRRLEKAEDVHDHERDFARHDAKRAILNVGVAPLGRSYLKPDRVALICAGQRDDRLRQGRGKKKCPALGPDRRENELEILAEPQVKHLVGLVQNEGPKRRQDQMAALDVVAQPPGRAHHDMSALRQQFLLAPRIHAAHARDNLRARERVKPCQLALDLQSEFASRRHDKRQRKRGRFESVVVAQQVVGDREPERDGLARARLCGDEKVPALRVSVEDGGLDGGRLVIETLLERPEKGRVLDRKFHGKSPGEPVRPTSRSTRMRIDRTGYRGSPPPSSSAP